MKGEDLAKLIIDWANDNRLHPDDFSMLFVDELLERMEESD